MPKSYPSHQSSTANVVLDLAVIPPCGATGNFPQGWSRIEQEYPTSGFGDKPIGKFEQC